MIDKTCTKCGKSVQFSLMDKFYLEMFGVCWDCDKKNWDNGTLSLEEFEKKETEAHEVATNHLQNHAL